MNWVNVNEKLPDANGRYLVVYPFMSHFRVGISYYAPSLEEVDEFEFDGMNRGGFYESDGQ